MNQKIESAVGPTHEEAPRRPERGASAEPVASRQRIPQRPADAAPLPLSFSQERVWFLEQLGLTREAYYLSAALRLRGALDRDVLQHSLAEVVRRHESLRTRFVPDHGQGIQVVDPAGAFELPALDLSALAPAERDAEAARLIRELTARRYDLHAGPLFRATLLMLTADENVLVLGAHHLVIDGHSITVLTQELSSLYTAYAQQRPSPLPEPALQYADYAVWQRRDEHVERMAQQLTYWKETLANAPAGLELPTDRPRPLIPNFKGAEISLPLPSDMMTALAQLARGEAVTLFMVAMATFQLLLSRWSGQDDIVVGTPISGRRQRELDGLIGFFANTLAFRTNLAGDISFRELLKRVKETALGAFAHQDLPFEKLVEELQPVRDLSRQPIFQAWLVLDAYNRQPPDLAGLQLSHLPLETASTQFDLTLTIKEMPDSVSLLLGYATDLFDAATVTRMGESFKLLLDQVTKHPERRLSALTLLPPRDEARLLVDWNDTAQPVPPGLLPDWLEHQAQRTPEAIALTDGVHALSYRQLNAQANQLAHHLLRLGVRPDVTVAVCLERSVSLVVALLAVLKAGGAYLPLDPTYPVKRMADVLNAAMAPVLITHSDCMERLPVHWGQLLVLDRDGEKYADLPVSAPLHGLHPAHLAYVLYTSGSTGAPKGVAVSHSALANQLAWMGAQFALDATDVLLQKTSFAFDASIWELFLPLLAGARLALATAGMQGDAEYLCQACETFGVTTLQLVPSVLQVFADEPELARCRSLRRIFSGGEALPMPLAMALRERLGVPVHNLYGPTEACVQAVVHTLDAADEARTYAPIGRPVWNTQVYVLDDALRPVPLGVPGELYLAGAGLARGYLFEPTRTAERFVAHPFGPPGSRLYRTADRVRWLAHGVLEFLGRTDEQVKIRGFRIELGEVQAALMQHPAVAQAAVVVREDAQGQTQLVGYIATQADAEIDLANLRQALARHLPGYMVPAAIIKLDTLPLNANGKLDRHALPAPSVTASSGREPRNPREEILVALFGEVLNVPRVSIDDNFFDLGGHSLLATKLVSKARVALGTDISIRTLFEAPTVASLVLQLEDGGPGHPPLAPAARPEHLPLSFAQQRLWFLHRFEGASATYNIPLALRLSGDVNVDALRHAFTDLVERHESLRTVFTEHDGHGRQSILPIDQAGFAFEHIHCSEEAFDASLRQAARHAFDLAHEVPIRAWLWTMRPDFQVLLLLVHHIASDGESWAPLIRDLDSAYTARLRLRAPAWAPLPVQYADFTLWQRNLLGGAKDSDSAISSQIGYWQQALAGLPEQLALPWDRPRPAQPSYAGNSVSIAVDGELHAGLLRLARSKQCTLFMALHAAATILLSKLGSGEDIPLGCAIAGRTDPSLDNLVGFFANTLVLRLATSGNPSFLEMLERARAVDLAAYAHQDLPFEQLVETLNPTRVPSVHPLFQVMLTLQNEQRSNAGLGNLAVALHPVSLDVAKFDLMFSIREQHSDKRDPQGMEITVDYACDLFDRGTAETIAQRFVRVLQQMVAQPEQRIAHIDLLDDAERMRILHDWNATARPGVQATLPALFEHHAQTNADALALEWNEQSLTYQQLNDRANQLAHRLLELGVGSEDRVAMLLERSIEQIVGMLAVVKAGAVYVPLHAEHPVALRKQYMHDAGARALLTDREIDSQDVPDTLQVLRVDSDAQLARQSSDNPHVATHPDSLAYIMYTSGSTGTPKGVAISHRNVAELATDRCWQDGCQVRVLHHSPAAFDASTYEIWTPLLNGGCLVLAPADAKDIGVLARAIAHKRISALWLTASLFSVLADENPQALEQVRIVWTGGEKASAPAWERIRQACPGLTLVNGYGPTETTTFATSYRLAPQSPLGRQVPIGTPLDNTAVYVLDHQLLPVPAGVPGELYIGGSGLARGYFRRAGLSAERFVANPFAAKGARMYRTGDLVKWLPDGRIEFVSRIDQQLKIHGFRVEPAEIEFALMRSSAIVQAAVITQADDAGRTRLIAYVVAAPGQPLDPAALRQDLAKSLPNYAVPVVIIPLEKLPLTPNGKLDTAKLPGPEARSAQPPGLAMPSTEVEVELANMLQEVLGIDYPIGIDESFFELGGHSIAAIQVAARLRALYDVDIPLMDLFESPTVRHMAGFVDMQRANWSGAKSSDNTYFDEGVI